jgi:hypothetical protein
MNEEKMKLNFLMFGLIFVAAQSFAENTYSSGTFPGKEGASYNCKVECGSGGTVCYYNTTNCSATNTIIDCCPSGFTTSTSGSASRPAKATKK